MKSITIGVDLGDKNSIVWEINDLGKIIANLRLENNEKIIVKLFLNQNWGYGVSCNSRRFSLDQRQKKSLSDLPYRKRHDILLLSLIRIGGRQSTTLEGRRACTGKTFR